MLSSYGVRTFAGSPSRAHENDMFASVGWRLTPREELPYEPEEERRTHARGFGRIFGGIASAFAGVALFAASYLAPAPEPSIAASYTHTHRLEVVDENRRSEVELGENAPDSLWRTVEAYIGDELPREPVERASTLVAATDALAEDNGYCAPSTWAAEHPDRVSGSLENHLEAAPCENGSPNPHYIERATSISTGSLESFVEDSSSAIETPVRATVYEGPTGLGRGLLRAGGALALAAAGAAAFDRGTRDEKRALVRDVLDHDPKDRPPGSASLYYGHAYLVSRDYLSADREVPLAGAAKQAVEGRATRLNRLAAALDSGYVKSSLEETVRDAIGSETTKRTAESYVSELAGMGHESAQRYLEMRSSEQELERRERKSAFAARAKKRARAKTRAPKGSKRSRK